MPYGFRHATPADKEWVYQLNVRCYRDVVTRQFGKWDEEGQREYFAQKWDPAKYEIIQSGERDIGLLSVTFADGQIFLTEIQIDPEYQKRGIGTRIIRNLIAEAQRKGVPLRLRVLHENRAIGLYCRLGFSLIGHTQSHILMEKMPDKRLKIKEKMNCEDNE